MNIVLSQTSPTGRRNPYRTRWAKVGETTYKVESDGLYAPWTVWRGDLDDILDSLSLEQHRELGAEGVVAMTDCLGIAFNLTEARELIAADVEKTTELSKG